MQEIECHIDTLLIHWFTSKIFFGTNRQFVGKLTLNLQDVITDPWHV